MLQRSSSPLRDIGLEANPEIVGIVIMEAEESRGWDFP